MNIDRIIFVTYSAIGGTSVGGAEGDCEGVGLVIHTVAMLEAMGVDISDIDIILKSIKHKLETSGWRNCIPDTLDALNDHIEEYDTLVKDIEADS